MNTYVYEQKMNMPKHTKTMRTVNVETENRIGNTPPTTAAVTAINPIANMAMKTQPIPTPTAASDTANLLGLVGDRVLIDVID
jgi:hypothetical protein